MISKTFTEIIVYLFGSGFKVYIASILFCAFFEKGSQTMRQLRILAYSLYYLITIVSFIVMDFSLEKNAMVNFIGLAIVVLTYKGRISYKLYASVLNATLYSICTHFIIYIIMLLDAEDSYVFGILVADIVYYMIVTILTKAVDLRNGTDITLQEWGIILVVPLLTVYVSIVFLGERDSGMAAITGEISLVLINIMIFFMLNHLQKIHKEKLKASIFEQQNLAYENQMRMYEETENKIRGIHHDMKNHLIAIRELAENGEDEEIKKYIENLEIFEGDKERIFLTGNSFVDSFLEIKLRNLLNLGIKISVDATISSEIFVTKNDISIILGNLLDNAVTALDECRKIDRYISIIMKQNYGNVFISIENSFSNEIKKIGNIFVSTKEDSIGHGMGIENVKRIVEKYNGNIEFDISDNVFIVKIILFG